MMSLKQDSSESEAEDVASPAGKKRHDNSSDICLIRGGIDDLFRVYPIFTQQWLGSTSATLWPWKLEVVT